MAIMFTTNHSHSHHGGSFLMEGVKHKYPHAEYIHYVVLVSESVMHDDGKEQVPFNQKR